MLELGANLAGSDREFGYVDEDDVDELSNSGISTVNSTKMKHHNVKDNYDNKILLEQVKILKNENSKLINELLESQKSLHNFLKSSESGVDALKSIVQQFSTFTRNFERSISYGYHSDDQNTRKTSLSIEANSPCMDDNNEKSAAHINNNNTSKLNIPLFKNPQLKSPLRQCHDTKLVEWLTRNGFDEESKSAIGIADFTYEDFIYFSDKDDIRRIGLR